LPLLPLPLPLPLTVTLPLPVPLPVPLPLPLPLLLLLLLLLLPLLRQLQIFAITAAARPQLTLFPLGGENYQKPTHKMSWV
jgi:hypothetical protein